MEATEAVLRKRLTWACRRGMLELDVILEKLSKHIESCPSEDLQEIGVFLELEDVQLWDMLVANTKSLPPSIDKIIEGTPPQ